MRIIFVLLGTLLFTCSLFAQSGVPVRGQVLDELGAAISGAKVTLTAADGKKTEVVANAAGEFTIQNVAPGVYDMAVEFPGFQTYTQKAVQILPAIQPFKVTMAVAAVNITEEVKAESKGLSVEPDQNLTGIVLDEKMIQELLPETEEEILQFLQNLAGGDGNAQILIDGFNGGRLPPREAIMSVRINQNLFSAEFAGGGGGGGGRIEIITRPGNGTWRGSVGFGYHNSALDARNAFALSGKPESERKNFSFNFGGPIIKKRLDFNVNVDRSNQSGFGLVTAATLAGQFTTNVAAPSSNYGISARAGLFINAKNTMSVNYNLRSSESTNSEFGGGGGGGGGRGGGPGGGGGGGGSLMLPERASNRESDNHSLSLSETFIINSRMIHETRIRFQRNTNGSTAVSQGLAINVLDAFQGGGSTCCPDNTRTNTFEFQDYLSIQFKKQAIKIGFVVERESNDDISGSNFNGTYTFSTLDQYRRVVNGERVNPLDPTSPLVTATQFTLNRGNPLLRYSQYEASLFAQDDIRFRDNLTISLGLRYEFQQHLEDKLNFAPRIGVAWSPFKSRKTTIRAGGGIFLNRLSIGTYASVLRYDNQVQETITIINPLYFNPLPADLSALGTSFAQQQGSSTTRQILDPNLRAPYSFNGLFSIEQQLPKALVGTFSYSFNRGIHLFRTRNVNALFPCNTGDALCINGLRRPDPTQGNVTSTESAGKSIRHELSFGVSRRFSPRLFFNTNYHLAWAMDDGGRPADNYNLRPEWARSSGNRRHTFNVNLSATLPWNIRFSPNVRFSTGAPFNITTGLDDNRDTQFNDRPVGIERNADLAASLYASIPQVNRIVRLPNGTTQTLLSYLNTFFPNGVKAEGPSLFTTSLNVSKTIGFGHRNNNNQQAQNRQGGQPGDPNSGDMMAGRGGPGGRGGVGGGPGGGQGGGGARGGGGGGGGRGGGGGGGGFGGGGFGGRGGPGGNEAARFNLTFSASINNVLNHVNFNSYTGTLGSPYFGFASSAQAGRSINFNVRFNF